MEGYAFVQNISPEGTATILLYDQIGGQGINGRDFANEIERLQSTAKKINVRINSPGGSVLEGYAIVSAILNSSVPVDTYIDGLAASIAGVIAMAGQRVFIKDYGTLMLHNPYGDATGEALQK